MAWGSVLSRVMRWSSLVRINAWEREREILWEGETGWWRHDWANAVSCHTYQQQWWLISPLFLFYFIRHYHIFSAVSLFVTFSLSLSLLYLCHVALYIALLSPPRSLCHTHTYTDTQSDACGWYAADTFHDAFQSQCWHIRCCNQTAVYSLPVPQTQSYIHKSAFIKTNQVHYQWISLCLTRCEATVKKICMFSKSAFLDLNDLSSFKKHTSVENK